MTPAVVPPGQYPLALLGLGHPADAANSADAADMAAAADLADAAGPPN